MISGAVLYAQSQYETIKAFGFPEQSGSRPATVIEGSGGLLCGTSENGGSNNLGTIYRISKDVSGFTIIKSFGGANDDGSRPTTGLLRATDGLLYGTTSWGGRSNYGTVFRLTPDGITFETLLSFNVTNGAVPSAELIQGFDDFIYGTTIWGGVSNRGSVFRLNAQNGDAVTIKSFVGADGANPVCRLAQAESWDSADSCPRDTRGCW